MNGWVGTLLRVNLTNSSIQVEELSGTLTNQFLGGRGLASKILYDEVDAQVDPLSPENKIIFMTGPLTGTGVIGGRPMWLLPNHPSQVVLPVLRQRDTSAPNSSVPASMGLSSRDKRPNRSIFQ